MWGMTRSHQRMLQFNGACGRLSKHIRLRSVPKRFGPPKDVSRKRLMWIVLLITHSLLAFLLLGAITHQTLSVPTSRRLSFYIC